MDSQDWISESALTFGPFRLLKTQKLLLEGDKPVRLGSRALDLLIALVERAGQLVGKEELIALVWPRTVVEENSLRVQLAALRKVLGDGQVGARYIVNQPGRGYCFVAPVAQTQVARSARVEAVGAQDLQPLPAKLARMIGRTSAVAILAAQLATRRFVTIVGAGGIGKTTVALAVAEALSGSYAHGVRFIDLAPVAQDRPVAAAVAAGLGLSTLSADPFATLGAFLGDKQLLLVLDNCEHLIDPLVPLIEHLLKNAVGVHLLVTSREPLRAEGEWLHRLPALGLPPVAERLAAAQAMAFPAVELFVERATASLDSFELTNQDALVVCELCRRLDGNALAIELAAARVHLFGVRGLVAQLDEHVLQLRHGRRNAMPRHQTLASMLDWSYRLLTPTECRVLRRLAVFRGAFTLDAARELVTSVDADGAVTSVEALDAVVDLAEKSLLTSDASGEIVYFRLLELTRAFALEKLIDSGCYDAVAARHAALVLGLLGKAAQAWPAMPRAEWTANYGWVAHDIRAALAWAFSDAGDPLTGALLTAAAWPLTSETNAFDDPRAIERAIAALAGMPTRQTDLETRLHIALSIFRHQVQGPGAEVDKANRRAIALAQQSGSAELEAQALMGVVQGNMGQGLYTAAASHMDRLDAAAQRSGDVLLQLVAARMGAQAWHFAGEHARARALAEHVLRHHIPRGPFAVSPVDHGVSMRIMQARILWIEGFADQAAAVAQQAVERATADSAVSLCQALSLCACPIALWRGDAELARSLVTRHQAAVHALRVGGRWLSTAGTVPWWLVDAPDAAVGAAAGLPPTAAAVDNLMHRDHLMTVSGARVTPAAAARAAAGEAPWCAPEILRAHADNLLHSADPDARPAAQDLLEQSMRLARQQGALAWELRTATSLARLWRDQGRIATARDLLEAVFARFTEGFGTSDLASAAALLQELSSAKGA